MIPISKPNKNIKDNNLLINNDKYSKNFVDVEINLKNNKQIGSVKTKYKTQKRGSKLVIPPFNNKGNEQKIKNDNITKKENKINNIPNNNINFSKNNNKIKGGLKKKQYSSNLLNENKKDMNIYNNYEIFNSDISIISASTTKNTNITKDRIKSMLNKIESIYKEAFDNSQKIKSETLRFNMNYTQKDMIAILL